MSKSKRIIFYLITLSIPLALLVALDMGVKRLIDAKFPVLDNTIKTYQARISDEADPDAARRIGHPFALFVLNYKYAPVARPYHINSLGYTDDEFSFQKEPGEYRILAFGGSTTVGYAAWPNKLEEYLNSHYKGQRFKKFSVYNFGIESYTSMQSVITMAMHGVDYKPDLIIVHDGYNDAVPISVAGFRNDYAHLYRSWHIENVRGYPWVLARLIRRSTLVALASYYIIEHGEQREIQSGEYIPGAKPAPESETSKPGYYDRPKYVFERNLNSLRVLAADSGAKLMVLTGPFKGSHEKDYNILNVAIREFASRHPGVLLCDLQTLGAALEPYYVDAIHVNEQGQAVKGQIIGDAVLEFLKRP